MTSLVDVICPCGKLLCFGYDNEHRPCMIHELPICKLFESYDDPSELLAYLNKLAQRIQAN